MILGVQYYRPPFPVKKHWQDDLSRMRDAGLNTVQLWAIWGWIESTPGLYRFDDYDELIYEAGQRGLHTVLSTIAEIHPFWIHREIPDSHMLDHMGHTVISSLRRECNVGLTPGGCTDHPQVRERLRAFLSAIGKYYADEQRLLAWDCWNENRWAVHTDGHVCYCPHTLQAFRHYLTEQYGDLDGLNTAWQRRYCSWEDVMPGKLPGRPYTDMVEFERFLTRRAAQHMAFRYQQLRSQDPRHPILAHCPYPSTMSVGMEYEQALSRGNDWDHVDALDGYGCSHFPLGKHFEEVDFGTRTESVRSAARGKTMWVSELQGGSARYGFSTMESVPADMQQRCIWSGYARGAKAILFWCWRDEVFGCESSGFGLVGNDGLATERLQAMLKTSAILHKHNDLLEAYQPDDPKVGVLFEEGNYHLDWAQNGSATQQASSSLVGYLRGLERIQVPYEVVDGHHLDILKLLNVLILPWPMVIPPTAAQAILAWVEAGGTLLTESELDAFDQRGFYQVPGEERTFATALGIRSLGRRLMRDETTLTVALNDKRIELRPSVWLEPLASERADVLARMPNGDSLLLHRKVGKGQVFALGTYAGYAYWKQRYSGFEDFLREIVKVGAGFHDLRTSYAGDEILVWRTGRSGNSRLLFVLNTGETQTVTFTGPAHLFSQAEYVEDLVTGTRLPIRYADAEALVDVEVTQGGYGGYRW